MYYGVVHGDTDYGQHLSKIKTLQYSDFHVGWMDTSFHRENKNGHYKYYTDRVEKNYDFWVMNIFFLLSYDFT